MNQSLFVSFCVLFYLFTPFITAQAGNAVSIGTNLSFVRDYESEFAFLDLFKRARAWLPQTATVFDTKEQDLLWLDENGWVVTLKSKNPDLPARFTRVSTLLTRSVPNTYPSGRYVVLYEGKGVLRYQLAARLVAGESVAGRDVIEVDAGNPEGILLTLLQTDPENTGDYIRNIRVYYEADLARVERGEVFNAMFLDKLRPFSTLRFMAWMNTNKFKAEEAVWGNRPRVAWGSYVRGVPLEVMIALANELEVDAWFCLPHLASDEYIAAFAEVVKANLKPHRVAYFEFSNEVWNRDYPQNRYAELQGRGRWGDKVASPDLQWYGMRSVQMAGVLSGVFASESERARVRYVISAQTAALGREKFVLTAPAWVAEGGAVPHEVMDVFAITAYVDGGLGNPKNREVVRGWLGNREEAYRKAFQHLYEGNVLAAEGQSLPRVAKAIAYHAGVARGYGLQLVAYEAGQHVVGIRGVEKEADLTAFFIDLNRQPEMGVFYRRLLETWRDNGGGLFNHFVNVSLPRQSGSWGALESMYQSSSPKYGALLEFVGGNK